MDKNILQKNSKILRKKSEKIPLDKIGSKKIKGIIEKMKKAVDSRDDGVAIAAPQIGETIRMFLVSKKAFKIIYGKKDPLAQVSPPEDAEGKKKYEDKIFINPELTKISKEKANVEEGCLSIKEICGLVERSKKTTIKAYDENGKLFTMGGSGLMAQIFQHEMDHLDGVLFTDKTKNTWKTNRQEKERFLNDKFAPLEAGRNMPADSNGEKNLKIAFFGTSNFSVLILEELKKENIIPLLIITVPDKPKGRKLIITPSETKIWAEKNKIEFIQPEKLDSFVEKKLIDEGYDLFIIASYGKIIPKTILDLPKFNTLNVHPSLLPKLRGASPIKSAILEDEKNTGVTIMLVDKEMDHGPIVASKNVEIKSWPPKSLELEKNLAKEGGKLLAKTIPCWINNEIKPKEQEHELATYSKKIKKEDALMNFDDDPYLNYRKIQAFDDNPRAYFFIEKADSKIRASKKIRVIITDAKFESGELKILRVIPEGKKEISYDEFQKGLR